MGAGPVQIRSVTPLLRAKPWPICRCRASSAPVRPTLMADFRGSETPAILAYVLFSAISKAGELDFHAQPCARIGGGRSSAGRPRRMTTGPGRVRGQARAPAGRTAPASRPALAPPPRGGRNTKRTRGARKGWGLGLQASQRISARTMDWLIRRGGRRPCGPRGCRRSRRRSPCGSQGPRSPAGRPARCHDADRPRRRQGRRGAPTWRELAAAAVSSRRRACWLLVAPLRLSPGCGPGGRGR